MSNLSINVSCQKDYEDFDLANEMDELEKFLKIETTVSSTAEIILDNSQQEVKENGNASSREVN